jgi:hypothetical protein
MPPSNAPKNGYLGSCNKTTSHGHNCAFICRFQGRYFDLTGASPVCQFGNWTGSLQSCTGRRVSRRCYPSSLSAVIQATVGKDCDALGVYPEGTQLGSCAEETVHGNTCSIECEYGYELVGAPPLCIDNHWMDPLQICKGPFCFLLFFSYSACL